MPRLFVAIDAPPSWHAPLHAIVDDAFPARWTPPEQYHVTLRFIGEVPTARTAAVEAALTGVQVAPFTLKTHGLLAFPSRRRPRVLAVGIEKTPPLARLHAAVGEVLDLVGISPETRPYRPHLTVARLKGAPPEAVHAYVRAHEDVQLDPFSVQHFHLYESTLHPDGARHEQIYSAALTE